MRSPCRGAVFSLAVWKLSLGLEFIHPLPVPGLESGWVDADHHVGERPALPGCLHVVGGDYTR